MKKILISFLLISMLVMPSFASSPIEEYIIAIENGEFFEADLTAFQASMSQSFEDRALELFLSARLELDQFEYAVAYQQLKQALDLVQKGNAPRLEGEIHLYLLELDNHFFKLASAIDHAVNLKALALEYNYTKLQIEADYLLAYAYLYYYDYDEGLQLAKEIYNLSSIIEYSKGMNYYTDLIGVMYDYDEDEVQALEYYETALSHVSASDFTIIGNDLFMYQMQVVDQHLEMENYEAAKSGLDKAERLLDGLSPFDQSYYYTDLGDYYFYSPDAKYEEAAQNYEKALEQLYASPWIEGAYPYDAYVLRNLADIYNLLGDFENAAYYYEAALNVDYGDNEQEIEASFAQLDELKLQEINTEINSLEELNARYKDQLQRANRLLFGLIATMIIMIGAIIVIFLEIKSKRKTERELYINSITDSLTQVYNRGKIIDLFSNNLSEDNAVILLDIDDFKNINDTYGHVAGDHVLVEITKIIKGSIRETDRLGRYGGEEFLIFLENTMKEELIDIGERIRLNIEKHEWPYEHLKTTVSIGITPCFSTDAEEVLHEADTLMYMSKNNGKNKVSFN